MTKQEFIDRSRKRLQNMEHREGGSLRTEAFAIMDLMRELITEVDEGRIP